MNFLKALWIVLSETINILRNLQKNAPESFTIGLYNVQSSLQWSFIVDLQSAYMM